jgi:pilus assembly protein CpaF
MTPAEGALDERLVLALCRAAEHEPGDAEAAVRAHVRRVAPLATAEHAEHLVRAAVARLDGLGALDALVTDERVDEVLVNPAGDVWTDRHGQLERRGTIGPADLAVVIERILTPLGRRLDRTNPIVDARLPDGSRVCAVVDPVAVGGTCLSLRRFQPAPLPLDAFATPQVAALLEEILARRCNVVVSGATSSGKTSLLASLLSRTAPGERIVTLEDTAELNPTVDHLVRLEARPPSIDGAPAITLDRLLRTALRLRPDRLVVGEVRGSEVVGLMQALNTGHDGALSTCHANGALDALHRLETLVVQSAPAWPLTAVRQHLARCVDVVVHLARTGAGTRRVSEIAEVVPPADDPTPTLRVRAVVADATVVGALGRRRR